MRIGNEGARKRRRNWCLTHRIRISERPRNGLGPHANLRIKIHRLIKLPRRSLLLRPGVTGRLPDSATRPRSLYLTPRVRIRRQELPQALREMRRRPRTSSRAPLSILTASRRRINHPGEVPRVVGVVEHRLRPAVGEVHEVLPVLLGCVPCFRVAEGGSRARVLHAVLEPIAAAGLEKGCRQDSGVCWCFSVVYFV